MASLPKRLFFLPGDCSGEVRDGEGIPERLEDTHHDNGLANSSDQDYFQSYSDIHIHETMLADHVRTNTYRWAILKNYPLFYGKVVLDVGAGTGILSMFAVQAGARRVYAVEASQLANQLSAIVRENKMADRISVIHGKIEDVVLPEKVDVIVSEWMGYFLLYESMLNSVIYARDKWLKPEGVMMPSSATLFLAPISDEDYQDRLMFWRTEVKDMYKVSMETIIPLARRNISQTVTVKSVSPEAVQSHAQVVCKLDLTYVKEADLKNIEKNFHFSCFGCSELNGFLAWFEVEFPQKIVLSTSPYMDETHWQQAVMYIDEPASVRQDTIISGCVKISPNSPKSRFLDISLQFAIGEGSFTQKIYHMNDIMS